MNADTDSSPDAGSANPREATPQLLAERYQFIRTIARGGMSVIYLAQDIRLDRPVAVKVLFAGLAHNPDFVERFRREARSAARLNHHRIVKVYDSGQDGNIYFIIMEYLEGESLSEVLRREGALTILTSMRIAEDVAEALAEAHRQGVVHRDIKPGNIIFVPTSGLKVADFGIARAISGSVSDLTQAGTVMGTATYFSPEQAKGESVDWRTDLYSLGVVMYEMLSGKPPFHGDSPISVAYQHVQTEPAPLYDATRGAVPVVLSDVVAKLLSKDPAQRYQDAEQLRTDLAEIRQSGALHGGGLHGGALHGGGPHDRAGAWPLPGRPEQGQLAAQQGSDLRHEQGAAKLGAAEPGAPSQSAAPGQPPGQPPAPPGNQPPAPPGQPQPPDQPPHQHQSPNKAPLSTTELQVIRQRRRTVLFWGSFGLLLAIIALVLALIFINASSDSNIDDSTATRIEVPNVIRQPEEQAQRELDGAGFTVKIEREENATIPAGQVIRQEPRGGSKHEPETEILLTVSLGAQAVSVPDVVEYQLTDAQRILSEAGLVPFLQNVESPQPVGEIVAQDPPAGQQRQPGSQVVLSVSTGLLSAEVPDVAGLSLSEAARMLVDLGLTVEQRRISNDTIAAGTVISTDPPPGASLQRGEVVAVFISTGPSILAVPDVTGLDEAIAVAELRSWGLEVTVLYREVLLGEISGTVVEQNPLPNTNLGPNDSPAVTIIVGTPSSNIEPPTSLRPPPDFE